MAYLKKKLVFTEEQYKMNESWLKKKIHRFHTTSSCLRTGLLVVGGITILALVAVIVLFALDFSSTNKGDKGDAGSTGPAGVDGTPFDVNIINWTDVLSVLQLEQYVNWTNVFSNYFNMTAYLLTQNPPFVTEESTVLRGNWSASAFSVGTTSLNATVVVLKQGSLVTINILGPVNGSINFIGGFVYFNPPIPVQYLPSTKIARTVLGCSPSVGCPTLAQISVTVPSPSTSTGSIPHRLFFTADTIGVSAFFSQFYGVVDQITVQYYLI